MGKIQYNRAGNNVFLGNFVNPFDLRLECCVRSGGLKTGFEGEFPIEASGPYQNSERKGGQKIVRMI